MATTAGWLDGAEVVDVRFDPQVLPFAQLLEFAGRTGCDRRVWTTTPAQAEACVALGDRAGPLAAEPKPDGEPKYYLLRTIDLKHLPMTPAQAARTCALVAPARRGGGSVPADRLDFLSPRQRELAGLLRADPGPHWPLAGDRPFLEQWTLVETVRARRKQKPK